MSSAGASPRSDDGGIAAASAAVLRDSSPARFGAGVGQENARPLYRTHTAPVPDSKKIRPLVTRSHDDSSTSSSGVSSAAGPPLWGKIFVDVAESEDSFTIYADLPGCDKSDVVVLLKENVLQIRAERRRPPGTQQGCRQHRAERFFGQLSRALLLPTSCSDVIVANYHDGVLVVDIKKVPTAVNAEDASR
jgi:HSP20 family molecular chaperone IbpA